MMATPYGLTPPPLADSYPIVTSCQSSSTGVSTAILHIGATLQLSIPLKGRRTPFYHVIDVLKPDKDPHGFCTTRGLLVCSALVAN